MSDFIAREKKWQRKWKEQRVFQPTIDTQKEPFFITVPYPYANSVMHIGHGRTFTMADILARYQRLLGKNVLYPMGFHISGTPVLAVADAIAQGEEKQLAQTRQAIASFITDKTQQDSLLQTFSDPYAIAAFFSSKIEESFDAIGLSVDWSRQFTTGDSEYNSFITWQFEKLQQAGMVKQGSYPILYSPADENAVGEDDIKDGDIDKVTIQEMVYILFKDEHRDEYICVSTLRPDALFGTTNVWVNPDATLIRVKVHDKIWIVDEAAYDTLKYQYESVEKIETCKGESLLNRRYVTPLINRVVPIASASFIDPNHGTGMVYSSPAGSPHDYMGVCEARNDGRLPKDLKIPVTVQTKDKKGNLLSWDGECPAHHMIQKYGITDIEDPRLEDAKQELYKLEHYGGVLHDHCGSYNGIAIKHAKEQITQALIDEGVGGLFYETSRRAVTRSQKKVIVALLQGQWFLDYTNPKVKQKAYALLDSLDYKPQNLQKTQKEYLEWVALRPCARKRGIGTKLPFDTDWVIESLSDSTIYQMYYLIIHHIKKANIPVTELTSEFYDYVFLGKQTDTPTQIQKQIREEVLYWKAVTLRYTNKPHMSNHLSFLMYHYAMIFDTIHWPKSIMIGGLLQKDGQKISKSKGNGIALIDVQKKYGSDLYRLYVGVGANYDVEMDFTDGEIAQLQKKFVKLQTYFFEASEYEQKTYDSYSQIDKWLISRFYSHAQTYFTHMDEYRIREALIGLLYEFLQDCSYHQNQTSATQTTQVLRFILEEYILLLTPFIPHLCEEIYQRIGGNGFISIKVFNSDLTQYQDSVLEAKQTIGQTLQKTIARTIEVRKLSNVTKITIVQAHSDRFSLFTSLQELLSQTTQFAQVIKPLLETFPQDAKFIQKFVPKTLSEGLSYFESQVDEKAYLESLIPSLEKSFGCTVVCTQAQDTKNAITPGKPGVFIE